MRKIKTIKVKCKKKVYEKCGSSEIKYEYDIRGNIWYIENLSTGFKAFFIHDENCILRSYSDSKGNLKMFDRFGNVLKWVNPVELAKTL